MQPNNFPYTSCRYYACTDFLIGLRSSGGLLIDYTIFKCVGSVNTSLWAFRRDRIITDFFVVLTSHKSAMHSERQCLQL